MRYTDDPPERIMVALNQRVRDTLFRASSLEAKASCFWLAVVRVRQDRCLIPG